MTDSWQFDLGLLVAILVAIVLLVLWLRRRSDKRGRDRRLAGLRAVAGQVGGQVRTGVSESTPRSAALRPPFVDRVDGGWIDTMSTVTKPAYEYALDVVRGRWPVRAAQAHYQKAPVTTPGPVIMAEYRIEIAISDCPPLKVSPVDRGEQELRHGPGQWSPVSLPQPFSDRLHAFADDQRFASAALNQDSLDWLAHYAGQFGTPLAIERDVLHMTWPGEIDPNRIMHQVDFLVGFLDRTPLRPGNPLAAYGPAGNSPAAQAAPGGQEWRRHLTPARLYQLAGFSAFVILVIVMFVT
ncbi:hypothetical protein [Amycolatopsis cihanbeyliensis]|uniref:Uncharacterized protein n=1 Tax=Amycolatopsis cihanbeyliensis TaxID=1128664 RepID=A0A542DJE3_AMYCI|nr:hypothetical protein [Amycolatopsis cihanbeyliensis]TQJ03217.1 hypothetical protein FB471_2969 [Amycolatopsis cihanbeyliensis]